MAASESKQYPHPQDKLFNLALKAVREFGYKIDSLDKVNGLINFKTGASWKTIYGSEMSLLIMDNGDSTCSVDINGDVNRGKGFAYTDWGNSAAIARKIFDKIEEQLKAV